MLIAHQPLVRRPTWQVGYFARGRSDGIALTTFCHTRNFRAKTPPPGGALTQGRDAMRRLFPRAMRAGALAVVVSLVLAVTITVPANAQGPVIPNGDDPILRPGAQPLPFDEVTEEILQQRDIAFISRRTAGDNALSNQQAGAMRAAAAHVASDLRKNGAPAAGPATFTTACAALGPNPIAQQTRGSSGFTAMSRPIGPLALPP